MARGGAVEPPWRLVYRSERSGRPFVWGLSLHPRADGCTELRLRFRGRIRSRGLTRRLVRGFGELADRSTGQLMIRGLRERLER